MKSKIKIKFARIEITYQSGDAPEKQIIISGTPDEERREDSDLRNLFNMEDNQEVRTLNTLWRNGIRSIEQLKHFLRTKDLTELRNIGQKSAHIITEAVWKYEQKAKGDE